MTQSQYVKAVESWRREMGDFLRWMGKETVPTETMKIKMHGLANMLDSLSKCPKCQSSNAVRTHEWASDVSGTVYCIDMKCLECGNTWSW